MGSDGVALTDAQRAMVEENTGLVWWWVNRTGRGDSEDERQETYCDGVFGLIRAVQKFDPSLGYKFSTYALFWIRQATQRGREIRISRNLTRARQRGVEWTPPLSLDALMGEDITLADLLRSDDDVEGKALGGVEMERLARHVQTDLDRSLVENLLGNRTLKEIADEHGVTPETTRRRRNVLKDRLSHLVAI